jgi:hypothetical protein
MPQLPETLNNSQKEICDLFVESSKASLREFIFAYVANDDPEIQVLPIKILSHIFKPELTTQQCLDLLSTHLPDGPRTSRSAIRDKIFELYNITHYRLNPDHDLVKYICALKFDSAGASALEAACTRIQSNILDWVRNEIIPELTRRGVVVPTTTSKGKKKPKPEESQSLNFTAFDAFVARHPSPPASPKKTRTRERASSSCSPPLERSRPEELTRPSLGSTLSVP